MRTLLILSLLSVCLESSSQAQKSSKQSRSFGEPIWTDSTSTMFIPIKYNEELLSANKIALWGEYYSNIVVYNFLEDSYKRLFPADTYVAGFGNHQSYNQQWPDEKNMTDKWVFMFVKRNDYNESGRVDSKDPSVLYVATVRGDSLKQLTLNSENVVSFRIYEKQGFALLKLQRDSDGDGYFKEEDKEYYYRKISLADLSLGKPIEIR